MMINPPFEYNKNDEKLTIESKFNNKKETFTFTIDNSKIQITAYHCKEMEIDGFFKIRNFSKNLFDEKEASILYSNIDEREEDIRYCMIEAKMSSKKVN